MKNGRFRYSRQEEGTETDDDFEILQSKMLRMQLSKAVNSPINTLSHDNAKEKLAILDRLLKGDDVEISGQRISVRKHPKAKDFCVELIAKKLVVR